MEIIIILFVIYGIVSSISKKRAEERKRQERQTKARLQNAYPPDVWPRRDPPDIQYEQPDVPQQVYNEPPQHVISQDIKFIFLPFLKRGALKIMSLPLS